MIVVHNAKLLPRGSFTVLKVNMTSSQVFGSGTLSFIARLTDMSELILRDSAVFGADMKAMIYLTQLKTLDLSGTQVTDQHMEPVTQVKTLKRLDLCRTAVSKSMIEQIKVALPEC